MEKNVSRSPSTCVSIVSCPHIHLNEINQGKSLIATIASFVNAATTREVESRIPKDQLDH
jgi:hypothetical protein